MRRLYYAFSAGLSKHCWGDSQVAVSRDLVVREEYALNWVLDPSREW